jgi:hypothetical protein
MAVTKIEARKAPVTLALRPRDAAAALGVSESYLAKLVGEGKIRRPVAVARGVSLYDCERLREDWEVLRDTLEAGRGNGEEANPWDRFL